MAIENLIENVDNQIIRIRTKSLDVSFNELYEQPLIIDDTIIDTESNLWYVLLQKNLYKIGLPIDLFDMYRIEIDALVNRRNSIAHGNSKSGVDANEYQQWEGRVYNILADITRILYDYALHKRYLANK